ncbi:MAG: NUDIX domain-containing protein [Acidimicrobiales bacterium]
MVRQSAGLLVYRRPRTSGLVEMLLAHPGGPYFARKDIGAWTIPKGEPEPGEELLAAAEREFAEEIGLAPPEGPRVDLGEVRQASGKRVRAFAVEGDIDLSRVTSNLFELEWPPRSGRTEVFPEVDRAGWFDAVEARVRLNTAQAELVGRLTAHLEMSAADSDVRGP